MKYYLSLSLIFLGSLQPVRAQVFINEFVADLPSGQNETDGEWVELYNSGDTELDLSGYVLADAKDNRLVISPAYVEGETTKIASKGYLVVLRRGSKFSLNNNEDEVLLFESTQSAKAIDHYGYSSTKIGLSWGRIPDAGEFTQALVPTPGKANQPPPQPSPTPEPSPTPAPIPQPTPTIKPTATSVPQSKLRSYQSTNFEPMETNPPEPRFQSEPDYSLIDKSATQTSVLGIESLTASASGSTSAQNQQLELDLEEPERSWHSLFFILGGLSFTSLAGYRAYQRRKDLF